MKIVRFAVRSGGEKYGVLEDEIIRSLQGSPFDQFKVAGTSLKYDRTTYKLKEVKLLAPCLLSKIVAIGLNYKAHIDESTRYRAAEAATATAASGQSPQAKPAPAVLGVPKVPILFLKPSTAVIGSGEEIIFPPGEIKVEYEGELGAVIGRKAKNVTEAEAKSYVLGYTCFNDVSERIAQHGDGQWTRGKSYDTFAPIGPWIEMEVNPDDLKIETYLNGEVHQSSRTSLMIAGVSKLINFISGVMKLLPGDVIATGTPAGVGKMNPGDTVEVRIEGIGSLINRVAK